ncbi:hypothetical protein E2C01_060329 [Portunus trituberculatus]|uniref:Uncharacterized protein n=1 Tax=Portunus trituberculatus TaxID=210409 RepID=A0A5B7H7Q7_PORTR|nr:hypothetical protein [Portunus trituberculatus]
MPLLEASMYTWRGCAWWNPVVFRHTKVPQVSLLWPVRLDRRTDGHTQRTGTDRQRDGRGVQLGLGV